MEDASYNISGSYNEINQLKIKNKHEQIQLKEQHEYDCRLKQIDKEKELEILKSKLGFIGRCFGGAIHSSKNITFVICLFTFLYVVVMLLLVFFNEDINNEKIDIVNSVFNEAMPVITLALGYLFGKK